jgi:hypothetical protein
LWSGRSCVGSPCPVKPLAAPLKVELLEPCEPLCELAWLPSVEFFLLCFEVYLNCFEVDVDPSEADPDRSEPDSDPLVVASFLFLLFSPLFKSFSNFCASTDSISLTTLLLFSAFLTFSYYFTANKKLSCFYNPEERDLVGNLVNQPGLQRLHFQYTKGGEIHQRGLPLWCW